MPATPSPARAARYLQRLSRLRPSLAIVLGSGFKGAARAVRISAEIPVSDIPGFPRPQVSGHGGEVLLGTIGSASVLLLNGRVHYYEGHEMDTVTFGIRVLAAFGIKSLLLTNAAGGINPRFEPGDFMIIEDHINLMGANPLRTGRFRATESFLDMTNAYDRRMRTALKLAAKRAGTRVRSGVYLAVSGPSYETPAEIRAFRTLGADAVGMSTVPEAIVARQCGMRVAAISCITNPAAGNSKQPISHDDVIRLSKTLEGKSRGLLKHFIQFHEE